MKLKQTIYSKANLRINKEAFDMYEIYKSAKEIIDKTDIYRGKKKQYVSVQCSTIIKKGDSHGKQKKD
ncbi:MAG: hypothetical protein IAE91_02250 [Ignavibacteriaceae bacterium]|nr:hypothetical protein [Ignavibacteriaceae bacterium]